MTDKAGIHPKYFEYCYVAFVAFLLLSNIAATKLIEVPTPWTNLVFDGGAILFPLTYILGDVLTEVYGLARARKTIITGFALSILASLTFWLVQLAPPAADWHNQEAFEAVLGFVPRIVAASLGGFVVGQLLNSVVLARMKQRWGEKNMWTRLIGSTLVGEGADSLVFCTIAYYGIITGGTFLNYLIVGWAYKVAVEVVLLPLTYAVIGAIKRAEPAYSPQAWAQREAVRAAR
ncbi:queuosine precursor transporter [Nanchangia anserum]|uniref:Probable queuosine precursor transporter n=1 Tax=Nanchangia anserum TaxID=2692125 RepID=A0A8I0GEQ7_9ACTO|nr:queuosine precursor transporter [Nanchangia anserum]MBD3689487.1 queuosine precursor transporter [Nanchangia anserum]QOX81678.1 queuosine precursor transporter [Nanchangia anserum]